MKKTPSVWKRDYEGTRLVYDEVVAGCEWVPAGEGVPTVKLDGTACMSRDGVLYRRHDRKRKRGKLRAAPEGWEPCEPEPNEHTGHWPGWVPVGDGPEDQYYREADLPPYDCTCELLGPKVQGNPHGFSWHILVPHGLVPQGAPFPEVLADLRDKNPRTFDEVREWLSSTHGRFSEGIVWHHEDGRMAKIKRRDFGLPWPPDGARG